MPDEIAAPAQAATPETPSTPSTATPAAELSNQDTYLDAIGMADDENEFNPDAVIEPKGKPEKAETPDEPEAIEPVADNSAATSSTDPFMAWVSKHTPEQIESLLKATQPAAPTPEARQPEPELSLDEVVKPMADHFTAALGEDAAPAVKSFAKAMLKQVGDVFNKQISEKDATIKGLTDQVSRIVAHIERQEVTSVLEPLAKVYPDIRKPGARDQVEAKMRALAKTDEYATLADLAADAALLTFGKKAVAAGVDAQARAAAAARAGQANAPKPSTPKITKASYDQMRSRIAELAASGAGAERIKQEKTLMGW